MYYLQHIHKTEGYVLPLPQGLQELMTDISREVLRCQPTINCTYKFIADYLDAMIEHRDKHNIAMEIINEAILKTDEVYSQFVKCNIPKEKTKAFLDAMEITFRRFIDKKRQKNEENRFVKFHPDELLEDMIKKCDLTKVEVLRSRPAIQWAFKKFIKTYLAAIEGTLETEDLYFDTDTIIASTKEFQLMVTSAVIIQKVFRGYLTRKSLHGHRDSSVGVAEERGSSASFMKLMSSQSVDAQRSILHSAEFSRKKSEKQVSLKPFAVRSDDMRTSFISTFIEDDLHFDKPPSEPVSEHVSEPAGEPPIEGEEQQPEGEEGPPKKRLTEEEAAVLVQAAYKGNKVRKEIRLSGEAQGDQRRSVSEPVTEITEAEQPMSHEEAAFTQPAGEKVEEPSIQPAVEQVGDATQPAVEQVGDAIQPASEKVEEPIAAAEPPPTSPEEVAPTAVETKETPSPEAVETTAPAKTEEVPVPVDVQEPSKDEKPEKPLVETEEPAAAAEPPPTSPEEVPPTAVETKEEVVETTTPAKTEEEVPVAVDVQEPTKDETNAEEQKPEQQEENPEKPLTETNAENVET